MIPVAASWGPGQTQMAVRVEASPSKYERSRTSPSSRVAVRKTPPSQ